MPDQASVQNFLGNRDRTLAENLAAWLLLPFSFLYRIGTRLRSLLYRLGIFKSTELPVPVISVGGLTIGGSGKTPVVMYIADYLVSLGKRVVILTRGYGGESNAITIVRPDDDVPMDRLSDEVRMMAGRRSATIAVGADRVAAFEHAIKSNTFDVAILDDGFQHLKIKRNLDIVVLDATAPYGSGYLLPSGNLREPKSSLKRADMVIMSRLSQSERSESLQADLEGTPAFGSDYVCDSFVDIHTGEEFGADDLGKRPIFAFSAIASPESFLQMIEKDGAILGCTRRFRDHHLFTQSDVDELVGEARARQCGAFAVTEKDAVKLQPLNFTEFRVYCYKIRLEITQNEDTLRSLIVGVFNGSS
ncbi:MAG: tetraacyldisaccharide 4'-kinase [Candidatus Zixiibacteriota bacterium]